MVVPDQPDPGPEAACQRGQEDGTGVGVNQADLLFIQIANQPAQRSQVQAVAARQPQTPDPGGELGGQRAFLAGGAQMHRPAVGLQRVGQGDRHALRAADGQRIN
jgi:hypothetical protein